jgi:hypothetical protein
LRPSPPRELVIVSANLKKALPRFLTNDSSLVNFAHRIPEVVPYAPDALLLQEVVHQSAHRVTDLLADIFGSRYVVAVAPDESAFVGASESGDVVRNAAIVLNQETLRLEGEGDYVPTAYPARDARAGIAPRVKEHPHCLATSVSDEIAVALASVHFVTNDRFVSPAAGFRHKARWARGLATFMRSRYPRAVATQAWLVGGDFNNRRCRGLRETARCRPFPFWRAFIEEGYVDAVFERHAGLNGSLAAQSRRGRHMTRRIDYLFVRGGRVLDASHDLSYDAKMGDPRFYSDHRLLWALIGPTADAS